MTIFLVIVGIAALVLVHELGHFIAAKLFGMRVDEFGIGFPPRLFKKKIGETVYSVNAIPLGGFVKLFGEIADVESVHDPRSFSSAPAWKRSLVIVAGVATNFIVGWLIISAVFFIGTPSGVLIERVLEGTPASSAGLKMGDFLRDFKNAEEFQGYIKENQGSEIQLRVSRSSGDTVLSIVPRLDINGGSIGVAIVDAGVAPQPFFTSIKRGAETSFAIVVGVVVGLWKIIYTIFTQGQLMEGFTGPVGVFGLATASVKNGLMFFLQLLGIISLNLGVLNILPFPALDGGRLFFIIIEKIKGSRLTPNFEMIANGIGFFLLISLMVAITIRDVAKLF